MSESDDTTPGGLVNYQNQCPHCSAINVIPADAEFTPEDDYCSSCGEHFYSFPEVLCTELLEHADRILHNQRRVNTIRAIVVALEKRGVTLNQFMIACEVLEYFDRQRLQPTDPATALPIFLGLQGEQELQKIIRRHS